MNCPGCLPIIDDGPHFNPAPELRSLVTTVGFASLGALCGVSSLWGRPSIVVGGAAIALSIASLGVLAAIWRYPRQRGGMRRYARLTLFLVAIALPLGVWATILGIR